MHDFESAVWAEHRGEWTGSVRRAIRHFLAGFDRLQRRRFDAPWTGTTQAGRRAAG